MTRSMPWDKFIKRELIEKSKVRYQNTKVNNDIFFNRVIVTEANKILFCGKRLVNYRINNEQSLQGKLNKNPTDFLKGNLAIYKELEKRGTYKEYQSSFEKMIVDDIIFHLKNVSSYDEFEKIFNEIKNLNFLEVVGITENTDAIQEHEYKNTLEGLYENQPSKCLAALYSDYKKSSTVKTSAEYIIGKKILGILKMSF